MHGTGIFQRVLFVIGWDGSRFRTAAAESLDYRCVRPTSTMDYALHVRWAFEAAGGAPVLRLDYELTRDEQPIGRWSDRLRWNAAQFAFAPYQATHDVREPVAVRIRNQVGHVRVYSASRSMNPASGSDEWMSNSELMDVLSPACAPSLSMFAREFVGKWGLDPERTAAHSGGASPDAALIIGWDRRALTVIRPAGLREVYRFDGTTTSVPVGPVSGRATAVLEGERMVVTVIVPGNNQPVRRVYYLDGQSLVIEESGGADGTSTAAYYAKS
jgi:hypothetical protein